MEICISINAESLRFLHPVNQSKQLMIYSYDAALSPRVKGERGLLFWIGLF